MFYCTYFTGYDNTFLKHFKMPKFYFIEFTDCFNTMVENALNNANNCLNTKITFFLKDICGLYYKKFQGSNFCCIVMR